VKRHGWKELGGVEEKCWMMDEKGEAKSFPVVLKSERGLRKGEL